MTRDKDFKTVVRARMQRTGETYTAARAALQEMDAAAHERRAAARREQQQIIDRWLVYGQLTAIPARRKVRAAILLELLTRFAPGEIYPESEVKRILERVHEDHPYLRREMVAFGYLQRDGGQYWVAPSAPVRTEQQRRELPTWEEIWLPEYVARAGAGHSERTAR